MWLHYANQPRKQNVPYYILPVHSLSTSGFSLLCLPGQFSLFHPSSPGEWTWPPPAPPWAPSPLEPRPFPLSPALLGPHTAPSVTSSSLPPVTPPQLLETHREGEREGGEREGEGEGEKERERREICTQRKTKCVCVCVRRGGGGYGYRRFIHLGYCP